MELGKFLISTLIFVFSIFLFPTLYSEASAYTGELSLVIHAFPILFIVVIAVFPIFFLFKEAKS